MQQTSEVYNESRATSCLSLCVQRIVSLLCFLLHGPLTSSTLLRLIYRNPRLHNPLARIAMIFISDRNGSRCVYAWFMKHFPSDPLPNFRAIRPLRIERWVVRVSRHDLPPSRQIFDAKRNEERRREILFYLRNEIPRAKGVNWAWSPCKYNLQSDHTYIRW